MAFGAVAGTASLALLYLTAASIFLNSELGPWVVNGGWRDQPRRVQLRWDSGTSFWPGRFALRGVEIHGLNRRVEWTATLERGRGTIDLLQLLWRRVRVSHVSGEGVEVVIDRRPEGEGAPPRQPKPRRRRWTIDLPEIALSSVREIAIGASRLVGQGTASGGFQFAVGEVSVTDGRLEMPAARLESRGGEVAEGIRLVVEAGLAPYVPREQPGALGLDFLSGTLETSGRLTAFPAPAAGAGGEGRSGSFEATLTAKDGRLQPGSRLAWSSRGVYPLSIDASVAEVGGQPLLRAAIDAQGFQVGGRDGKPPLLESRTLHVSTASAETRLSRVFGKAREMRAAEGEPEEFVAGEFLAEGLSLDLRGRRMACRLAVDRATGRLDLGAFLHRDLFVEGMRGDGVSAQVEVAEAEAPDEPTATRTPWSLHFIDTRLAGFREIGLDTLSLTGAAEAEASFALEPGGRMTIEKAALRLPEGRLVEGETVVAREVAFRVDGKAEPFDFGRSSVAEALGAVSGTTEVQAQVSSLGFLRNYFERARWLGLQGRGHLAAKLTLDHGRLVPGSRLAVDAVPIEAQILGAVATGRGRIAAEVETGAGGDRLALDAWLDRFTVDGQRRERLLEGGGLALRVTSAEAVQLGAKPGDLRAVVDIPRASLPDLSSYNALLPPGADVTLLPGSGQVRLNLDLDGATHTGKGHLSFRSQSARLRVQELIVGGQLSFEAPLASSALLERRFEIDGARLILEPATYHELSGAEEPVHPWWARAELPDASLTMGRPIIFDGSLELEMKDSGPFLALFAQRRRFLRWFSDVLLVEGVVARAGLKLDGTAVTVDPLEVSSDKISLASRMRFAAGGKHGDLFLTYGNLAVGIELRDGKRDFKLLKAREWFESWWKR